MPAIRKREPNPTIPRAIRTPKKNVPIERLGARRRKRALRAERLANRGRADTTNTLMPRQRMFESVQNLFNWARVNPPQVIIEEKVRELNGRRKMVVFEIGSGYGGALGTMLLNPKIEAVHDKIEFHGMDIFKPGQALGIIWHQGNALSMPFPKSDIIFSQVSVGYMGHFGFLAKKAAHALHQGGIAVLHVNKYGLSNSGSAGGEELVRDMAKLQKNMEKLKPALEKMGCEIATRHGAYRDMQYGSTGDLAIVIRKK